MKTINAIIVDDEKHAAETLQWEIERSCPEINILRLFNDPIEARDFLFNNAIDLLFLDIEMPEMNGFDLLRGLPRIGFGVIFTTAYDQFAIEAIRLSAVDYLLKPVNHTDVRKAVDRFLVRRNDNATSHSLESLMKYLGQAQMGKVAIPTATGFEFHYPEEIRRCESDSNYSTVFFTSGEKMVLSKTLKDLEEVLAPHGFIRIHHSHLVNGANIRSFVRGDGGYVVLDDDTHISVSRSRKDEFLDRFK
ncbi:MAG: response regulator transcription factor [Flavobacteriales bacterium]|nr:response regulator transcription factor [Flavobacteriales bacterium]